jgi:acid phosphatase
MSVVRQGIAAVLGCALLLTGCATGSGGSSAGVASRAPTSQSATTQSPTPSPAPSTSGVTITPVPSPTSRPPRPRVDKLLVFVVENHSLDQMRGQMPYTRALAERYGYASDYVAITHPSLPNYLAIAGGSTFGVQDDDAPSGHQLRGSSAFGEAAHSGATARVYAEAMGSPCQLESAGRYAVKHNPWAYFVDERAACRRGDLPLTALAADVAGGSLPNVGMVIPDLCNDAHDCALGQADGWMRRYVGRVLAGPDWASGRLAVVITADEDDNHHGNRILTVVLHPALRHRVVSAPLDHYSLTRAYADVAGVPPPGMGASAPSLLAGFGLSAGHR